MKKINDNQNTFLGIGIGEMIAAIIIGGIISYFLIFPWANRDLTCRNHGYNYSTSIPPSQYTIQKGYVYCEKIIIECSQGLCTNTYNNGVVKQEYYDNIWYKNDTNQKRMK